MTRLLAVSCVLALSMPAAVETALAGANPDVHLALDCQPRDAKRQCTPTYDCCEDINWTYQGTGYYDIIVVLYHYRSFLAIDYGIDFSDVADWYFTGYMACQDGYNLFFDLDGSIVMVQAWFECQYAPDPPPSMSGLGIAWLKLYGGPGRIDIVPDGMTGDLVLLDCNFELDEPQVHPGFVGGALPGPDDEPPCTGPSAAEPATWGGIKVLYR